MIINNINKLSFTLCIIFNIIHPIVCISLLLININIDLNNYSIFSKTIICIIYYIYFPIINIAIYIKYIINTVKNIKSDINLICLKLPMENKYIYYYLLGYPIIALIINIIEFCLGIIVSIFNNDNNNNDNFIIGNYIFYSIITILIFIFSIFIIYKKIQLKCSINVNENEVDLNKVDVNNINEVDLNNINVNNENDPLLKYNV